MSFDWILRRARIAGAEDRVVDIGVRGGRIAAVETQLPAHAHDEAPWWPPHKIAGRHLAPYLATHADLLVTSAGATPH